MKSLFIGVLVLGSAKYCSKLDIYERLDRDPHPAYVHKMELTLATDLNSDDSATAQWAKEFMADFEPAFRKYQPDKKVISKLQKYRDQVKIKVVGGIWCSDTRRELPRLCKVLYYMGVPASAMDYYRVNKEKVALENDFASTWTKAPIPDIMIYKNDSLAGHIYEVPRTTLEKDLLQILKKSKF